MNKWTPEVDEATKEKLFDTMTYIQQMTYLKDNGEMFVPTVKNEFFQFLFD